MENSFVLEKILKNRDKVALANEIFSRKNYNKEAEKKILRIFNVEKSSIGEYILALCCGKLNKTRKTLSFEKNYCLPFMQKK